MRWRTLGVALVALAVGAGGGWALAARDAPEKDGPERTSFATPVPIRAADPEFPVRIYQDDPDDPALEPGIPLDAGVRLTAQDAQGRPSRYSLSLDVPKGWTQSSSAPAEWRFTRPGNDINAFGMRVKIVVTDEDSVARAIANREAAWRSADVQPENTVDSVNFTQEDSFGFRVDYVEDGYKRVAFERWIPANDGTTAFATVAVFGRERDVAGMEDLINLVYASMTPIERPAGN